VGGDFSVSKQEYPVALAYVHIFPATYMTPKWMHTSENKISAVFTLPGRLGCATQSTAQLWLLEQ